MAQASILNFSGGAQKRKSSADENGGPSVTKHSKKDTQCHSSDDNESHKDVEEVPVLLGSDRLSGEPDETENQEINEQEADEPPDIDHELEEFRQQWKEEIKGDESQLDGEDEMTSEIELEARQYFLMGTKLEQEGALYEAIEYYKKAIHLVPDIEMKCHFYLNISPRERQESESSVESCELDDEETDLLTKFHNLHVNDKALCRPATPQRVCHISALPVEVLIYIFKWVVSSQLDMTSLENISLVCRGFYLCARDEELWRLACLRVWGNLPGKMKKYGSWRNMYIERPHLQFVGCYISKMSYLRQGEQSLDNFYKPWHEIVYYRYLRFFSEGLVFMMTSPEDPLITLPKLKSRSSKVPGMLRGYYRLAGNKVTGVLQRIRQPETTYSYFRSKRNKNQVNQNDCRQTYHIDMEVTNVGKRNGFKLLWKQYSISTFYKSTGEENITDFEITNKSYPPLVFSRVKSYSALTEDALTL